MIVTLMAVAAGLVPAQPAKCDHAHRSTVARHRITLLLRNYEPQVRSGRVRHYQRCVATVAKQRRLVRYGQSLRRWRRGYPQRYAILFNRYYAYLRGHLDSIAACESHGDPTAIGGGGAYRGKYQFAFSTWASVGGHGDPAAAHEFEQDYRAAVLLARYGAGHWPVCG